MMKRQPIRVLLLGLAGVVDLVLVALVAVGVIGWDSGQIAAVVAAVSGVCVLVAEVLRASVYSPASFNAMRRRLTEQATAARRGDVGGGVA